MRRALFAALALGTFACSAVLGVDDFSIRPPPADVPDSGLDVADTSTIPDSVAPITETGVPGECKVNADCMGRGEFWVCRKSDQACVSLQSQDCSKIVGSYKDDNAIIIGSVLPTTGDDLTSGVPIENAIALAIQDFSGNGHLPPRPGTTARRPLVLVGCTDASDDDVAVRAAKHLAEGLEVPAIIGAAFSGITIKVATDVTIPAGTLLISPSATSVAITGLQDDGLVWRTSPSDVIQAQADVKFFPWLEQQVLAGATRDIKVAIANKGDPYGRGLAESVSESLVFNGKAALAQIGSPRNFAMFDYGDATPKYTEAVTGIATMRPDVVFLFGTTETLTELMKGIEKEWPTGVDAPPRPRYILADGSLVSEATAIANGNPDTPDYSNGNLRRRIVGTIPGTSNTNFLKFQTLYNAKVTDGTSPSTGGAANAYDALYNIAFSIVAAGDKPITGKVIAEGFAKQVMKGAGNLDVGFTNINTAFQKLSAGQGFDFNGASGPLDYDLETGEAPSDIQFWCLPEENGIAGGGRASPLFYNAQTEQMQGTYEAMTQFCNF
ncbi:MAG: ABC transporter substrate-binding protein [Labilithrix sp.]|nr:ABC transporter substrate-binding protein [Labilithrix sp.]MCW5818124.1 ABC transporter substrate-binding protein [Labilithrix sp.]